MIFREYRPSDFAQVDKLWKETDIYTEERGNTNSIILRCNDNGGKFIVMEDQEKNLISGTSWMTFDGRRIHLHHFAIKPACQGKGYGKALALESLKFARELGCPLKLEVHRRNEAAINLYKNLGFDAFGDYEVFMIMDPDL